MAFQPNDKVKKKDGSKVGGITEHTGCFGTTTAGGKICSKKNCPHPIKDYLFVRWPDGTLSSGNEAEFELEAGENEAVSDMTADELLKRAEEALAKKKAEEAAIKEAQDKLKAEKFDFDKYNSVLPGSNKRVPYYN